MERWTEREETVSLAWLKSALVAQWRWVALGTALGVGLGALLVLITPKQYEGEAKIFVDSGASAVSSGGQLSMLLGGGSPDVNTQVEILLSRALLERVQQKAGIEEPYRDFSKRFEASSVRNTTVITVSARHDTPESAAELTNLWIEEYRNFVREIYDQNPSTLVEKLSKELDAKEQELRNLGQKIVAFLKSKQAVMPDEELKQTLNEYAQLQQSIQSSEARQRGLDRQLAEVRAQLAKQPQFHEQARTVGTPPEVQQLNNRIAELEIQRTSLLEEFQSTAPEVKQVEAQLAQARKEREKLLQRAVDNYLAVLSKTEAVNPTYQTLLLASLQAEAEQEALVATLGYLRSERDALEKRLRNAPELLAEFNDLQRQYQASLTIWTEKTRAYEQARAQQLVGRVSPIPLESASLPDRPVAPRPVLYTAVSTTLGLMFGVLMAIMQAFRVRRLSNRWEVERLLGVPVILELPSGEVAQRLPMAIWAMRSAGAGELWHSAVVVPLDQQAESQKVAHQLAQLVSGVAPASPGEENLPEVLSKNGALHLQVALPEQGSKDMISAERMVLVCQRGYEVDEGLLNLLQLSRPQVVGVILVGQEAKR